MEVDHREDEGSTETNRLHKFDIESTTDHDYDQSQFPSMEALEILREAVRVLRFNLLGFMIATALLICPVSAVVLWNLFLDQNLVKKLTIKLLLVVESSGIPLRHFIKQFSHQFVEIAVASLTYFPLYVTLSLLAKTAVIHSVDCTYLKTQVEIWKFRVLVRKIWKKVVITYFWVCSCVVVSLASLFIVLVTICSSFYAIGIPPDFNMYVSLGLGLAFCIVFAVIVVICNIAIVVSVLEDVSGSHALLRANVLVKDHILVGLMLFLGSTIGMGFVQGLFDHRVNTISYGDGSSRIWEGPLLVVMYSFVVLMDSMTTTVFYFTCRFFSIENGEFQPIDESEIVL